MTSLDEDLRRLAGGLPPWAAGHPSDRDVIAFGRGAGLDVHETLGMVLKAQWEAFLRGRAGGDGRGAADAPQGRQGEPSRDLGQRPFHVGVGRAADAGQLFELFEAEEHYASRAGYDREGFESLVHHGVLLGLHRVAVDGPEMAAFVSQRRAEQALLAGAGPAARDAYWRTHCRWRELEDEVGTLLLEVETQALENERVQQRWLETFGPAYLALLDAESACGRLERRLRRKLEDPTLSVEELDRLEAEDRREEERELARLRRRLGRGRVEDLSGPGGKPPEDEELWEYEEECKTLLREIYRLTHPDAVGPHDFTEAQRELLAACYREAVTCGGDAVGDEEVALGMRSLNALRAILGKARKIWQSMGLAWNEGAAIRGDTLAERLAWLEGRIAELEQEARDVRADLLAAATDPDVREKRASLASPSIVARVAEGLDARTAALAERARDLEDRLEDLFLPRGRS